MRRLLLLLWLLAAPLMAQTQGSSADSVASEGDKAVWQTSPMSDWFDLDTNGALSIWVALDAMSDNGYLLELHNAGGEQVRLLWDNAAAEITARYVSGDANAGGLVSEDGAWHHYFFSWNTSSSGSSHLFIDGTLVETNTNINGSGGPFDEPDIASQHIGFNGPFASPVEILDGKLAHVKAWNGTYSGNEERIVRRSYFCVDSYSALRGAPSFWATYALSGGSATTNRGAADAAGNVTSSSYSLSTDGPPTNYCGAGGAQ